VCLHQFTERIDVPPEVLVNEFDVAIGSVSHVRTTVDRRRTA
jgi:hypothetical protein